MKALWLAAIGAGALAAGLACPGHARAATSDLLEIDLQDPFFTKADVVQCNKRDQEAAAESDPTKPLKCDPLTIITPAKSTFGNSTGTIALLEEGTKVTTFSDLVGVSISGFNAANPAQNRPKTYTLTISLLSDAETSLNGSPFARINEDGSTKGFSANARGFIEIDSLISDLVGPLEVADPALPAGVREVNIFVSSKDILPEPAGLALFATGLCAVLVMRRRARS